MDIGKVAVMYIYVSLRGLNLIEEKKYGFDDEGHRKVLKTKETSKIRF